MKVLNPNLNINLGWGFFYSNIMCIFAYQLTTKQTLLC